MMYKSQLQEFCQRRNWQFPKYSTVKNGPDHLPRFTAAVTVNGHVFSSPVLCRSSKEAKNSAAQIAFDHFNTPSAVVNPTPAEAASDHPAAAPPAIDPPAPVPAATNSNAEGDAPISVAPPPEFLALDLITPSALAVMAALPLELPAVDPVSPFGMPHVYKNQLQQYTDRENLGFPVYATEGEGPPHDRRFKSKVSVGGKSYQTSEFFPTLKEAEQAAAKVACQALSDGGLYKNLLQEFAQKRGLLSPLYETTSSGLPHNRVFVSTVEIGKYTFRGTEAKTKKLAETSAAKVAFYTLAKGCLATKSSQLSCTDEHPVADNSIQNIQPTATIKKHQDTRYEDDYIHAKRAKPSTGSMNIVDAPSPSNFASALSNVTKVGSSFPVPADHPAVEPTVGDEPSLQWTVKNGFPAKIEPLSKCSCHRVAI